MEFAAEHHPPIRCRVDDGLRTAGDGHADRSLPVSNNLHFGPPTGGHGRVRDAIAASYSGVVATDVLGFAGAGEAIFWAMQLFVDPATM